MRQRWSTGLRSDPCDERAWDRSWGNRAEIYQAAGMAVAQLGSARLGLDATGATVADDNTLGPGYDRLVDFDHDSARTGFTGPQP
jgi:hypothetical protein